MIEIYTDGSCLGNPGPGGWAFLVLIQGNHKTMSGGALWTTNNQMEMTAVIEALKWIRSHSMGEKYVIFMDSTYVMNGITQWITGWKNKNFHKADGTPVKNKELWIQLDDLKKNLSIEWKWVKAHNGNKHNEHVDMMAKEKALEHSEKN